MNSGDFYYSQFPLYYLLLLELKEHTYFTDLRKKVDYYQLNIEDLFIKFTTNS